jgi:hypothetical protein
MRKAGEVGAEESGTWGCGFGWWRSGFIRVGHPRGRGTHELQLSSSFFSHKRLVLCTVRYHSPLWRLWIVLGGLPQRQSPPQQTRRRSRSYCRLAQKTDFDHGSYSWQCWCLWAVSFSATTRDRSVDSWRCRTSWIGSPIRLTPTLETLPSRMEEVERLLAW